MTTDYHQFCFRGTPLLTRNKLNIGDLYLNGATCLHCDYFIRSRNRHDMVSCKCGKVSVDGGSWYAKRTGNSEDYVNHIEYFADVTVSNE